MTGMKIYASLDDDIGEGFVWLLKPGLRARAIVRITNPTAGQTVVCEALQLDANFLKHYNQSPRMTIAAPESAVVMSGWYRARLGGLQTQHDYPLKVVATDSWFAKVQACMHHPQIVVRVAVWLGVLSVALGLVGALLGVASVWPHD